MGTKIMRFEKYFEKKTPRRPFSLGPHMIRSAAAKVKEFMRFDRAYYQKTLYVLYDEMGIIYFTKLSNYAEAYKHFSLALENCQECAKRDPHGSASGDVEYISSRLNSAKEEL